VIEECEQQPEDLDAALALIAQTNAIGVTLAKAEEYAALARQALQGFPDNDLKALLLETASYSASRAS
jgi:octaprenyl-diphosphate synthase